MDSPTQTQVSAPTTTATESFTTTTDTTPWTVKKRVSGPGSDITVRSGTEIITVISRSKLSDPVTYQDLWATYLEPKAWEEVSPGDPPIQGPFNGKNYSRAYFGDAVAAEFIQNSFLNSDFNILATISAPGSTLTGYGDDTRLKSLRWRWVRFDPLNPFDPVLATPAQGVQQTFRLLVQQANYFADRSGDPPVVTTDELLAKGVVEIECKASYGAGWHQVNLGKFSSFQLDKPTCHADLDFSKWGYSQVRIGNLPISVRGYATTQSADEDSYVGRVNDQNVYEHHRVKIEDTSDYTGFKTEAKSKLKIAQWGHSDIFDDALGFVHAEFKKDVDIFRVRLPDIPVPAGSVEHRVKIWTTDKTGATLDSGAHVDLNIIRTNPADPTSPVKFHETAALALVADDATDDEFAVEGKVDGQLGDRTYRAVLGGTVKIQWTTGPGSGAKPVMEIPVPAERTVKVQGFLLKDTASLFNVNQWFDRAKKIYSAAGVDLDILELKTIDPLPEGVNLTQFDVPRETIEHLHEMMPETIALMDDPRCAVPQDTIPVFFVNALNPANAGVTNVPSYMVPGEEGYGGAIFINSGHTLESVLAHELAHVLLDAQHDPSTNSLWNDIFSDTREKTNVWWGDISHANGTWSESGIAAHSRLTDSMRSRIWKSRYAKLPAP